MKNYEHKLEQEKRWYQPRIQPVSRTKKILNHPLILNSARLELSYHFAKERMSELLAKHTKDVPLDSLLIAPCGTGIDYSYVSRYAKQIHGIDISEIALSQCPPEISTCVGDIMASDYPDESFDAIVSPLFFHHMRQVGFNPFLQEFKRILKKGGILIILEPSLWYPLNIITRPIKFLNNPYNEVEDEGPVAPSQMIQSLKQTGYSEISMSSATFCHPLFPVPISRVLHKITQPLASVWPCNVMAWMIAYSANKK